MDQKQTPIFDALLTWKRRQPYSFHVPGHKNGIIFPEKARDIYASLLSIDATELTGLDDLHEPESAIFEAEQLAASFYGSKACYFLVGGSTVGNLAMILATCQEDDIVFVQRNSHKSVMNGLELANAKPVFLMPEVDEQTKVAKGVSLETIEAAYAKYPEAKTLVLTNPNYYGMTLDLRPIIEFAKKHGMTVLVDEAHGAHFGIGKPFPESAVSLGADVVVQSAHKTLPAMTMGSYLHVNGRYRFHDRLRYYLTVLQSSSPSYPIMASLDLARFYLAQIDSDFINMIIESFHEFEIELTKIEGLFLIKSESERYRQDPLKLIVQHSSGVSGFQLQQALEKSAVYPELADMFNVLFILPLAPLTNRETLIKTLTDAFKELANQHDKPFAESIDFHFSEPFTTLACSYKEMINSPTLSVPLHRAVGEVSAESVIPYPPGIPLLMKGEKITVWHVDMIRRLLQIGARFQGGKKLNEHHLVILK